MEEFGFALRVAREKRGLTQTQVMRLTGINNKTLSGYENGVSEPDLQTLATLLRLYHASADRLLRLEARPRGRGLPEDEEQLLALYRELPEERRGELLHALRALAEYRRCGGDGTAGGAGQAR